MERLRRGVRLSEKEILVIKKWAELAFGKGTKVYLFGSRAYPEKKGGDIDLYVKPMERDNLLERKVKFLAGIWAELGEQKVDVVIETDPERPIERIALKEGVEL
ncbi:MAG: nucleotidyltransferase domain-containing protein [Caldimicrobium sp.]|jgi:predicted nucleotidyltransferase|nr:nucleotidyltransferase domain-containing protein [Caldimicrobium sp.]